MTRTLFLSLLAGCGWNNLPQQHFVSIDSLWDPNGALPTEDGLYVPLTQSGGVALLRTDGTYEAIDLGEGRVTRIAVGPDNQTVLAFVERYTCTTEDVNRSVNLPDECDGGDLETSTELSLLVNGEARSTQPISGAYNQVAFTDDGSKAVAFLDFGEFIDVDVVLNLTSVVVIDLAAQTSVSVPVGFAADRVLFVEDESGAATRAVVVSRNQVGVVDLTSPTADLLVTFPLTLDPDLVVDPVGVELTPDGNYALLSARGSSDLYALDLGVNAINIVELAGAPAAMAVSDEADRTVLVFGNSPAVVQIMDHAFFDTEEISLDEGMNHVEIVGSQALLWSDGDRHDVYRIDLSNNDRIEYRLQNPAVSMHVAPTNDFAVALTRPEGFVGSGVDAVYDQNPGMEIIDLQDDDTEPFLLVGQGLGVAFAANDTSLNALVLQQGVDYLFRLDLYTRETEQIDLSAPPVAIGSLPDGRFFITHDRPLGLVSFLDPANGEIVEVGGFASSGIIDPIELVSDDEEAP